MVKKCKICGKCFECSDMSSRLFCSRVCAIVAPVCVVNRECQRDVCKNSFQCKENSRKKYCSSDCVRQAAKERIVSQETRKKLSIALLGKNKKFENRTCIICGVSFECTIASNKKCCCKKCGGVLRQVKKETRNCFYIGCSNTFMCSINSRKKFCSSACCYSNKMITPGTFLNKKHSVESKEAISSSMSLSYLKGHRHKTQYKRGYVTLPRLELSSYYRSSFEEQALLLLDQYKEVSFLSCESIRIPYKYDIRRYYIPDYFVTTQDGFSYIIEIKPRELVDEKINQLKFNSAYKFVRDHEMGFLIWTQAVLFNSNSSQTELSWQEIVKATAAVLCNGRIMIQSELYSSFINNEVKVERQAEMTCPPIGDLV